MRPETQPQASIVIVVIDDDPASLELLEEALGGPDTRVLTALDPEQGLDLVFEQHPQVVLTDLMMPRIDGLAVLDRIMEFDPSIDVMLMTAHYTPESAVEAIKRGASDYLTKPVALGVIREHVQRIIDQVLRRRHAEYLESELLSASGFHGMVGNSAVMWDLFARIRRVAPHYRTALITGATGTGKELVAQALHKLSPVASGPFVPLNCSAVVETLFESELFGHLKGSFTGASGDKVGLFEHAHNGTLFLDEIGDMPLSTQAKLLRSVQNQEVQRLGALTPRKVNVRVIAATHRDLRKRITEGTFREDLYYRLAMLELAVPALRDRNGDLNLLIRHLIRKYATQYSKNIRHITSRAQLLLSRHDWPGNVRELENAIGHACIMTLSDTIDVPDLPAYLVRHPDGPPAGVHEPTATAAPAPLPVHPPTGLPGLEEQERKLIVQALTRAGGNQAKAARILRVSRDTLRYRVRKYGITVPD